jgi:aminopeptidase N
MAMLHQLQHSKDVACRWKTIVELTAVAKDEKTTITDKEKIIGALQATASSNAYWRLRGFAISQLQALLQNGAKPVQLTQPLTDMLLTVIKTEKAWLRSAAINCLGISRDEKYAQLYMDCFNGPSERVVSAAAIALGKSKSPKAFAALVKLKDKPSWKNQSLISVLYALKELGDKRAVPLALKSLMDARAAHWTLATPVWDHRLAAAYTLVALGKADKAYPLIFGQFKKAVQENNINDIFYNTQQVCILADPRGKEVFAILKEKFKSDANAMAAVNNFEIQFESAVKK